MNIDKTIEILEALASGCAPLTGEIIDEDSVLNDPEVNSALQTAIRELKKNTGGTDNAVTAIPTHEVSSVIALLRENDLNPTCNRLTGFFLGTRKFKTRELVHHPLYGKYQNQCSKGSLIDYFTAYLSENDGIKRKSRENNPWDTIDFFRKEKFNRLSEKAVAQLKSKIHEIRLDRTENLPEYIVKTRKRHFRSYEPWSQKEIDLLDKALHYTNDLELLSRCFGRSINAMESYGKKHIFQKQRS